MISICRRRLAGLFVKYFRQNRQVIDEGQNFIQLVKPAFEFAFDRWYKIDSMVKERIDVGHEA